MKFPESWMNRGDCYVQGTQDGMFWGLDQAGMPSSPHGPWNLGCSWGEPRYLSER